MRRLLAVLAIGVTLFPAGCAGHGSGHSSAGHTPTPSWTPLPAPTVSLGHFGKPVPHPGIHVDPSLVQLGRALGVDVAAELRRTERRADRVLRGRPVNVHVYLDRRDAPGPIGVDGATKLDTSINMVVVPDAPVGTRATLRVWLPFVFAHELNHAVRFEDGPGLIGTLLGDFVSEGVADVFAAAMFPDAPPDPNLAGVTADQLRHYWQRAQGVLYEIPEQPMRDEWLRGGGRVPHDLGYAIGTALIESVRAHHPHLSWAKLTRMDAQTLLEISHFRP
jgi:hypothetical protein